MTNTRKRLPARAAYGAAALASLVFMICNAENSGFWYDEFVQISYSGLDQTVWDSLLVLDPTPPLFNVLANLWYDLVPYGERWLLLLPQLATAGAVYVSALWGELLGGRTAGVWTAILLGSSQMVIEQCGFEFRGYGFYLFFSVLAFYFHALRFQKAGRTAGRREVRFALALTGLLYSHLFGTLLVLALAAVDGFLVWKRRLPKNGLLAYAAAGLAFLPWVLYFCAEAGKNAVTAPNSWMSVPTLWDVVKLAAYLCGNHIVVCLLFAAGVAGILAEGKRPDAAWTLKMVPLAAAFFLAAAIFLYGNLRREYESLWVKRYFTGLFPGCAVVCALGARKLGALAEKRWPGKGAQKLLAALGVLTIVPVFLWKTASGDTPLAVYYHREVTETLYRQADVREDDAIVLSTCPAGLDGWEEYYCEQKGRRRGLDLYSVYDVDAAALLQYRTVYLDYNFWEEKARELDTLRVLEEEYVVSERWDEIRLIRYVKKQAGTEKEYKP